MVNGLIFHTALCVFVMDILSCWLAAKQTSVTYEKPVWLFMLRPAEK